MVIQLLKKVHHHVNIPPDLVLSQLNLVHTIITIPKDSSTFNVKRHIPVSGEVTT